MRRTSLTALTFLATALAFSSCGGSGKSGTVTGGKSSKPSSGSSTASSSSTGSTGSTTQLTRGALIAKADAICRTVHARHSSMPIKSIQEAGPVLSRVAAIERTAIGEMSKLTPPASLQADWNQILGDARTLAGYTARYGQYAGANPRAARAVLTAASRVERRMAAKAKQVGFSDCAHFTT